MDLLAFAKGPALHWALVIMVFGFFWRLSQFLFDPSSRDLYWAHKQFGLPAARREIDSYVMHAGVFIVVFGFTPHIVLIRDLTGPEWPGLPIGMIWFAGSLTVVVMIALLLYRLLVGRSSQSQPGSSNFDDYFSWMVVFAPMATGLLAYPHLGGASLGGPYAAVLAVHILSAELLMVWLPFGKLMHIAMMPVFRITVRAVQFLHARL